MTPIHMKHGDADLQVIGFVISVHILGMFALSPLVGLAVDRWGGERVATTGGVVLTVAALLASRSHVGWSGLLLVALFLLGVGWSCTLVSGSTLLTAAVATDERPASQGVADVVMGLMGALGGAVAGVVVGSATTAWCRWGRGRRCRRRRPRRGARAAPIVAGLRPVGVGSGVGAGGSGRPVGQASRVARSR